MNARLQSTPTETYVLDVTKPLVKSLFNYPEPLPFFGATNWTSVVVAK